MEGMLDTIKNWLSFTEYRNEWSSFLSGLLFFTGWWVIFDIASRSEPGFYGSFYVCGIFATISLIMINTVNSDQIDGGYHTEGCCGPQTARLWLLTGFIMGFVSVIASIWILFQYFVVNGKDNPKYPGVALLIQNIFIFGSALLLKYGRSEERY